MLEDTPVWQTYIADGVQKEWSFTLPYVEATSIKLYISHEGKLSQIEPSLYTFDSTSNKLTYPIDESPAIPAGDIVLLWRETDLTQEEDSTHVAFKSNDIETMVDKLTAICQELADKQSRSIAYDPTQSSSQGDVDAAEYIALLEQYKNDSQKAAKKAAASEENAKSSETAAELSAQHAESQASDASGYADEAAQSAINAEGFEQAAYIDAGNAQTYAQEAYNNAKKFIAMPIGSIYYSSSNLIEDNLAALPAWDGRVIQGADEAYPGLWAYVVKHTDLQVSNADYESRLTTYGECPFYVIDTDAKTLRLPKYAKFLRAGTQVAQQQAGLPNITGYFGANTNDGTQWGGAFGLKDQTANGADGDRDSGGGGHLDFNASRSNAEYGRQNTVTPANTAMLPWVVAKSTVEDLIVYNGGTIAVQTFTVEEWQNLSVKPMNTLCLIDEDDQ